MKKHWKVIALFKKKNQKKKQKNYTQVGWTDI